jgi:hypothetical protein
MRLYLAGNLGSTYNKRAALENSEADKTLISYWDIVERRDGDMDIYLAGGENKSWLSAINKSKHLKALYSYYYLNSDNGKKVDSFMDMNEGMKIFLDSGGFSAFTRGVRINIDEYIDFIKKYRDKLEVYAVLDAIGDAKETMKNQEYMERKGVSPLPVFHIGSDYKILKRMVKKYDYIALGGLVRYSSRSKTLKAFLDRCFSIIKLNSKVHGFGMTGMWVLDRYPFYSVDSTAWLGGSMRAEIYTYANGRMNITSTKERAEATYKSIEFNDDGDKKWMQRVIHNAIEWKKYERYITNLWERRGIRWT